MQQFEYKVVPAPRRGEKSKAAKTVPERFAFALTGLMNALGREGWEYLRADTLPCEERAGLTGTKTQFQNMLVFRRPVAAAVGLASVPEPAPHVPEEPVPAPYPILRPTAPNGPATYFAVERPDDRDLADPVPLRVVPRRDARSEGGGD